LLLVLVVEFPAFVAISPSPAVLNEMDSIE